MRDGAYRFGMFYEAHLTLALLACWYEYPWEIADYDDLLWRPNRGFRRIYQSRETLRLETSSRDRDDLFKFLSDPVTLVTRPDSIPDCPYTDVEIFCFDMGRVDWYQEYEDFLAWTLDPLAEHPVACEYTEALRLENYENS